MKINVKDLKFNYGKKNVLNSINLEFEEGKFYGIVGPNGSGKTTLVKLIGNLLKFSQGSIEVDGENLSAYAEKKIARKMAFIPQMFYLNVAFTIEDVVAMGRYPYMKTMEPLKETDLEIVRDALVKTNLWDLRHRYVNEISGGELQRVILARGLAQQTDILLLDEPLSHLDIYHQLDILNLTRELCKSQKKTILCVMHDLNFALEYCDDLLLLNKGKIHAFGEAKEVLTVDNIHKVYNIKVDILEVEGKNRIIYTQ